MKVKNKFDVLAIIVANREKNHGLIGNDVLNINLTKLVNKVKAEEIGMLKNYEVKTKGKYISPLYFEVRKMPVYQLPIDLEKLKKLLEQDLLERVLPAGSKWASPLVILRKKDGDLHICDDYKIGVDSYLILNEEWALNSLAGMKTLKSI